MAENFPEAYKDLVANTNMLEKHMRDMQVGVGGRGAAGWNGQQSNTRAASAPTQSAPWAFHCWPPCLIVSFLPLPPFRCTGLRVHGAGRRPVHATDPQRQAHRPRGPAGVAGVVGAGARG